MIETTQSVLIARGIDQVWAYARDVERWAEIMPGYQSCEILDADNSLWTLKIGVGALVRTVKVEVVVDRWAGPQEVDFHFRLRGDPVDGRGTYRASASGAHTEVSLHVEVNGSGPMAPMWEAMGGPVLPKFAAGFANQLKERIEAEYSQTQGPAAAPAQPARASLLARLWAWLRRLFGSGA